MRQLPQKIILPKFSDNRGSLSFLESSEHLPFEIKNVKLIEPRAFVPLTLNLGVDFALVSLNGSIVVHSITGEESSIYRLSDPCELLIIPKSTCTTIDFVSNPGALLMLSK